MIMSPLPVRVSRPGWSSAAGQSNTVLEADRPTTAFRRPADGRATVATLWARVWGTQIPWATGQLLIAQLNPGQSVVRCHFGIRWGGTTSNEESMEALLEDFMAVGVVTQSSARGSTARNALTGADDQNPPLERWLWWATTSMRPMVMGSEHPDIMVWSTDVTAILDDTKGQVKANVPTGDTLDVYLTWSPWTVNDWQSRGTVAGNAWASTLTLV